MQNQHDHEPVVHSIFVLGELSLPQPLGCRPSKTNPGDRILDRIAVTRDLIRNLKGASVRLQGPSTQIIDGTLEGTQDFRGQTLYGFVDHYQIIVRTEDGEIRTAVPYKDFVIVTLRPKRLPFADAARSFARNILTTIKWFPTPPELSSSQASFIFDAVMAGCSAAMDMNNSDDASAQRYRESFELKRRAIEDPQLSEVMEECYQYGWNSLIRIRDKENEEREQQREEERVQAALRAQEWFDRKLFRELSRDLGRLANKWVPVTGETSRAFDEAAAAVNKLDGVVLAARRKWEEDNRVCLETLED